MSTSAEATRSYQIGFQSTTPANRLYGAVVIGSNSYIEAAYDTPLSSGVWYHVTLTYVSGIGAKLYLNGVEVANVSGTGNIQASPGKDLYIGCRYGTEGFFNGKIDEVRLYPAALSPEQTYQRYSESKGGFSNNSTIVSQETSVGEMWKCEVTPNDATQDGAAKTSSTLTVVSAGNPNLIIESIVIDNQGGRIYANDTYADGNSYYISVNITVKNTGTHSAGQFNVSLQVYWTTGSQQESLEEMTVSSLNSGENTTLVFYWRPTHTHYYNLTANADCNHEIAEEIESDNTLSQSNVPVTVIGDIYGDEVVNIFDAVVISLAWNSNPGSGHWNEHADINHDGYVDILDAVRIGLHWGETW
jgi:hypothetical protein